ncbi:MAG: hypothetical protein M0R23_09795 [Bacteroidales bacterium]|nr:hypothetical protein [Bacteroidales bacterium]
MDITVQILTTLLSPLVVGLVLWKLGEVGIEKRIKSDAIRDLMTYRGDYASTEFRRSLNKISVTFHNDEDIRMDVRHLYEVINSPAPNPKSTERSIVGLIYKLCQRNGFKGLTEYDIDQAFPENKQAPQEISDIKTNVGDLENTKISE